MLAGALALVVCQAAQGQAPNPLTNWQLVASSPQSPLRGIAHLNGRFVAAGISTNILVSTNGSNWFNVSSGLANNGFEGILAVDAAAGQFVAVGGTTGVILSSPDGLQWTRRLSLPGVVEFWAVTHGKGIFVAVGYRNAGPLSAIAATSPDGIHWETHELPFYTTPRNIAYGNGTFIAAGSPISMRSTNGRDWTTIDSLLAQGIAFGNGRFIATLVTNAFSSSNGVDWTQFPLPGTGATDQNYYTVGYANGTFITGGYSGANGLLVAIGNGVPVSLPTTFRTGGTNVSMSVIRDVIFVDGRYYLADQYGKVWRSGISAPMTRPRITRVARTGTQTSLTISTLAGFRYAIESTDRLDTPSWQPSVPAVFSPDDEIIVTAPDSSESIRFYRARAQ